MWTGIFAEQVYRLYKSLASDERDLYALAVLHRFDDRHHARGYKMRILGYNLGMVEQRSCWEGDLFHLR